ncbi:MAG TPA: BPL-N domain-containing protein [Schlesneria sp.]|jgi:N-formylglutamate amidohydrolase/glutamine amidotransferase PdxT
MKEFVIAAVFSVTAAICTAEESRFVHIEIGDLPIIISAPHGGQLEVPDVEPRRGEGLKTGGAGYIVSRDSGTEELATEVAKAITKRFERKPHLIVARSHRKFVDMNRPPEIAFENPAAKPAYDAYHTAITAACNTVQKKYHKGLLLDLHGQGEAKETVYRGTQNGKTVTLLRERFGEAAQTGEHSLFGQLEHHGWIVYPNPLDGKEQAGFGGGYIVQTYGSHQGFGIDAMQLEFGADYRNKEGRPKTAATLALALVDYAARYLDLVAPGETNDQTQSTAEPPESTKIKVGVYQGAGTGDSRVKLVTLLLKQPNLDACDLTVDDIRAGKWQGVQVLIHPGGSGGGQGKALGEEGRQSVREFVSTGGGFVGICAGAYLASDDYDWSLHILDAKVVDRQHWNRGFGTVDLSLSPRGCDFFKTDRERFSIYYHQGPLLAPASNPDIEDYSDLAKFETEIVKNGAAEGVMKGCTAIAAGRFHKGRVLAISPHPELTAGEESLLLRGIQWAAAR